MGKESSNHRCPENIQHPVLPINLFKHAATTLQISGLQATKENLTRPTFPFHGRQHWTGEGRSLARWYHLRTTAPTHRSLKSTPKKMESKLEARHIRARIQRAGWLGNGFPQRSWCDCVISATRNVGTNQSNRVGYACGRWENGEVNRLLSRRILEKGKCTNYLPQVRNPAYRDIWGI